MGEIYYREDGGKWIVKIISDKWEGDRRSIELECVKELRPSPICGSISPGEVWFSEVVKGYEAWVGWSLVDSAGNAI